MGKWKPAVTPQIERFVKRELLKLSRLTPAELRSLPRSKRLTPPSTLKGKRFTIEREPIKKGWNQISVSFHIPRNRQLEKEMAEWLKDMTGKKVSIGASSHSPFFFLNPRGEIEWPNTTIDD